MAKNIATQPNGLKEIRMYAWLIKCNGNYYIYSADNRSGLKDAMERVGDIGKNRGSRVRYTQIVK